MNLAQGTTEGDITYEAASFLDIAVHYLLLPFAIIEIACSFFRDLLEQVITKRFPEIDPKKPNVLIDQAFISIERRMASHGFTRSKKKRQLIRTRNGRVDKINLFGHYRNETGVWVQYSVGFEQTAPALPIRVPYRSSNSVFSDDKGGGLLIGVNMGDLRFLPRQYRCNLALSFRRSSRIQKSTIMVERFALNWFDAPKP